MTTDEHNSAKINELIPEVRWAGHAWLSDCQKLNLKLRILEAYRSQDRQKALYEQGRTRDGPIVTYTLQSKHTARLAVDVLPLNCSQAAIAAIASRYGITHPLAFDPPHYEFNRVEHRPYIPEPVIHLAAGAEMKAFARGILRLKGNPQSRAVKRFREKYGVEYTAAL